MSNEKGKRGQITDRARQKAEDCLGREVDQGEIRLMAYLQYEMMNSQKLDRAKITPYEREIIDKWEKEGLIERNAFFSISVSKKMWDCMSELLWLTYVDILK